MKGIKKFLIFAGVGLASLGIFGTQNVYSAGDDLHSNPNDVNIYNQPTSAIKTGTSTQSLEEWGHTLEAILAMLYGLMWPLIAIAGTALNNDIVFGKIFGLDRALFDFWSIMKNIANLAVGFLFVAGILMYLFNNKKGTDPKTMIPKFLLAVLGIQASWWLMMALVDIGTITTYAVGGLPMSVTTNNQVDENYRMYNTAQVPLKTQGNSNSNITVYAILSGDTNELVVPCISSGANGRIVPGVTDSQKFDWTNYVTPIGNSLEETALPVENIAPPHDRFVFFSGVNTAAGKLSAEYETKGYKKIDISSQGISTKFCMLGGSRLVGMRSNYTATDIRVKGNLDFSLTPKGGVSIKDYIETLPATQKAAGPLYSLYVSVLSMTSLGEVASGSSTSNFILVVILKAFVGLALMIPLAVLAVAMVMRVAFLWIIICFSPLIIMAIALSYNKVKGFEKFLNLGNIMSLIFLPTVVSFALSISVMFMTSLLTFWQSKTTESQSATINGNEFTEVFGIKVFQDGKQTCYQVANNAVACQTGDENPLLGISTIFTFLIVGLLGAAIMWNILFLALKSSDFTKGVAENIQGLGEGFLKSMPIVPVPGMGMVSTEAFKQFANQNFSERSPLITNRIKDQSQAIDNLIGDMRGGDKAAIATGKSSIKTGLSNGTGSIGTFENGNLKSVDPEKFVGLGSKIADHTNIDEYISDNKTEWEEMLKKLWEQSKATGARPATLDKMLEIPAFAGYMMATTKQSPSDILAKFYQKKQIGKINFDEKSLKFSKIEGNVINLGTNKKAIKIEGGRVVYTKNDDNDNFTAQLLKDGASADDIKSVFGDPQNGEYNFGTENIDENILKSLGFEKTTNGKWKYNSEFIKQNKMVGGLNSIFKDKKTFNGSSINSDLGKILTNDILTNTNVGGKTLSTHISESLTSIKQQLDKTGSDIDYNKLSDDIGNLSSIISYMNSNMINPEFSIDSKQYKLQSYLQDIVNAGSKSS